MKYVFAFCFIATLYLMVTHRLDVRYQEGYAAGVKTALKTSPPSEELEMTCAGLWVGEQNKKYFKVQK